MSAQHVELHAILLAFEILSNDAFTLFTVNIFIRYYALLKLH
jgi:hypothetical protein